MAEAMVGNQSFNEVATLIDPANFPTIRDAQLYIRKDGLIVNAEGWFHPLDTLIGEAIYVPDKSSSKTVFGRPYRKMTLYQGTYTPIPYDQRAKLFADYDPALDQTGSNPIFAKYKQIFKRKDFVAYVNSEDVFEKIMGTSDSEDSVPADVSSIGDVLGVDLDAVPKGFTGAIALGNIDRPHDVDIIFSGSLDENIFIARAMRNLVKKQPSRRLVEGGKGWNIRFFNDTPMLICSFFTYSDKQDAPLSQFEMEVLDDNVVMEGQVETDINTIYTPSLVTIQNASIFSNNKKAAFSPHKPIELIAYHTASRGECFEGDIVRAKGALVRVATPTEEYLGVCVTEREGIRNLTPTWPNFYDKIDKDQAK
jgi:predicted nucleotidyltransferase